MISSVNTPFNIDMLDSHLKHQKCGAYENIIVFGANMFGELGIEPHVTGNSASQTFCLKENQSVFSVADIKHLAAGGCHLVILLHDNRMFVCGNNQYGQIAMGEENPQFLAPVELNISRYIDERIVDVVCGPVFTVVITESGNVVVFGQNFNYQLGLDTAQENVYIPTVLRHSFDGKRISAAACGQHFCYFQLSDKRTLFASGKNDHGQLGLGHRNIIKEPCPVVPFLMESQFISKIACGFAHVVVLSDDGEVFVTGDNKQGQVGVGNKKDVLTFSRLSLPTVYDISCGDFHTIFLTDDNELYGCGHNAYCQLGIDNLPLVKEPIKLTCMQGETIQSIFCGGYKSFFVAANQDVWSLGYNYFHQLGVVSQDIIVRKPVAGQYKRTASSVQSTVDSIVATVNNTYVLVKDSHSNTLYSPYAVYHKYADVLLQF